jgi:hypothetical protein
MADLNALIAQGAQFNLPNPVDQYSKVMQLQSAQQQMQLNRQQMQQIQEDRAGFAKLREKLADQNLTPEQYESALTQAPDANLQKMGIELRMRRTRLADLDKEMGGGVKPAAMPAPMAAPVEAPAPSFVSGVDSFGKTAYAIDGAKVSRQEFDDAKNQLAANVQIGLPRDQQLAANALVAQPPAAAPVGNAMAAKQAQIAEINRKLDVLNSPRYSDLTGVKGQIDTLERQLKQLTESPFAKESRSNFTPASLAKFGQSGNPADLEPVGKEGTKSELARLMSERAALIASGAALTDNRVVAYDNAITKASAPSAGQPSDVTRLIAERNAAVIAKRPQDEIAALNAAIKKATTPAPGTTVNVSTEKKYGEQFAGKMADRDDAKLGAAEKAPQLAESANRIISLVNQGNLFTGPVADVKLNIARALNVVGASNEEKIANTESLIAATGQSTLDAIKAAGLGTGQGFTDKDLKFLQNIAGGPITYTAATLRELARLQHQTAVRSVDAWSTRLKQIPKSSIEGLGLSTEPIKVPPLLPSTMFAFNPKTGERIQSVDGGTNWTPVGGK